MVELSAMHMESQVKFQNHRKTVLQHSPKQLMGIWKRTKSSFFA